MIRRQAKNHASDRGLLKAAAIFVSVALFAIALLFGGCGKTPRSADSLATASVLAPAEVQAAVPLALCGDAAYAVVNSAALPGFYDEFRAEIFRKGVTKWEARFDCNHFAGYYVALAQTRFYLANFHTRTKAQSLALGVFWYQSAGGPHAIVVAITDRGRVFIEPQTGAEISLTPAEVQSAWLRLF